MSFCSPLQNSQPHTPERNDMHGKVQPNEIYIERIYDAPVKAVWEAWTVTDKLAPLESVTDHEDQPLPLVGPVCPPTL